MIDAAMEPDWTQALTFLKGEYSLSKYRVTYYVSPVSFDFLASRFSLIEELPGVEHIDWTLSELFQRDISWERVDKEIVKYLKNNTQAQFFNALTVALLPRGEKLFADKYQSDNTIHPSIAGESLEETVQIGGIQIALYPDGCAGKLRWNQDTIVPIAVDGQHRLAAIKRFAKTAPKKTLRGSSVPVIFLVLDEHAGFQTPEPPDGSSRIQSALRRMFIDLNKHAETVSTTRNILLDDNDFVSVCTRQVIGESLASSTTDRLSLAHVDWVSGDVHKIEDGPFLTTVLLLRDIIKEELTAKNADVDPDDLEEKRAKIETWLADTFRPEQQELDRLLAQVDRCSQRNLPLKFSWDEIEILKLCFNKWYRPHFVQMFNEIHPYALLKRYVNDNGMDRPEFINLFTATRVETGKRGNERAEKIVESMIEADPQWQKSERFDKPLLYVEESIKPRTCAFKVVFQRALFQAFFSSIKQAAEFNGQQLDDLQLREEFANLFVETMNVLLQSPYAGFDSRIGTTKKYFWEGIARKVEGTIDKTRGGRSRISLWLEIWLLMSSLGAECPEFDKLEESQELGSQHASLYGCEFTSTQIMPPSGLPCRRSRIGSISWTDAGRAC